MKPGKFKLRPAVWLKHDSSIFVAALFVCFVSLLGGGSRADIASLPVLRGVAAAMLAYLLVTNRSDLKDAHLPLLGLAVGAATILLQLLPLPPSAWHALPGRDLVMEIDREAGMPGLWRTLALDPNLAFNSLFSLVVPAVAVILAARIRQPDDVRRIVWVILCVIMAGALLGIFQLMSGGNKSLYLYRISNFDSSVGLFANRNHHALALAAALPLASYLASTVKTTRAKSAPVELFLLAVVVLMVPLIVLTGSRQGLAFAGIGLGSAAMLYRMPEYVKRRVESRWSKLNFRLVALILIPFMVVFSLLAGRMTAFDRLSGGMGEGQVDRLILLPWLMELARTYFPAGAGAGAFVRVFKVIEPPALLQPSYYNHAHNDFLEVLIEYGVVGLLFWIVAIATFAMLASRLFRDWRSGRLTDGGRLGLAGGAIIAMCFVASAVDYPLRVPSIQVLVAFSTIWLIWAARAREFVRPSARPAGQE